MVAANGDLYVADSGNDRISVFAGNGVFLRTFGEGELSEPRDVALDDDGRAFVADFGNDRVAIFSPQGSLIDDFGASALLQPAGVAVDGSTVFVADSGNNQVDVFTEGGEFLESIGSGVMASPRDAIVAPDGDLYVADFGNEEVDVFSLAGSFIRSFGDEAPGLVEGPVALAARGSEIFVADQVAERVERFDDGGDFLGGFAAEPGVAGVALACGGNVFVVEGEALFARVERFGEPGTPAPPCLAPPAEPVQVTLNPLPSNKFRFAGLVKNRSNGFAVIYVRVPGPGRVVLHGRGFRRLARSAARATVVRLPVKPKVRLRHFLRRHGKGRIRVNVTFKPIGGIPRTLEKVIVLRRKRR